MYISCEIYT
jgi:hypothetical protein